MFRYCQHHGTHRRNDVRGYDQKTLDHMEKDRGIDLGVGVMVPVGTKLSDFQKDWDGAVQAGWAFEPDTLEGLAKAAGMSRYKLQNGEIINGFLADVPSCGLPRIEISASEDRSFLCHQVSGELSRDLGRH